MTSIDEKNRQRNANIKQNQSEVHKQQRDYFDQLGLTKRNAEYMFRFHRAFDAVKLDGEKKNQIIDQMIQELLSNQKAGKTARNIYGTVDERIDQIIHPPKKKEPITAHYWPNMIYNGLFFFALFNAVYGAMYLLQFNKGAANTGAAGITTLLIVSLAAGFGMPILTKLFDPSVKHRYSGIIRFMMMIALAIGWIIIFILAAAVPVGVNPILNPIVNIAMAVLAFIVNIYVKKNYPVTTNFFRARPTK